MVSPLLLSRSEKGYRKCRCFVQISLSVHQIIICGKNGRTVRTACPCGCDSDPSNTQQTQTHPMFLTGGSTQNASTRSTTRLIGRCVGMPVWGEHTRTFLDFVALQSPLSQLSYHTRAREGNSDKFGHETCAILRESALRQF